MKNNFSLNIGLPSIVLIFLIMSLFSFSVLSLVSANSDWNLCQKALQKQNAYQNACNSAMEDLAMINEQIHLSQTSLQQPQTTNQPFSEIPTDYYYPISPLQQLHVALEFHNPAIDGYYYTIKIWRIEANDDIVYQDGLNVIP